mmetsp:Transcript_40025/g.66406  ORF Transcript_40025/g.66406 Transcript_40025/m.66406 type:complete len:85 (+) Transcript_40025:82-336(+)
MKLLSTQEGFCLVMPDGARRHATATEVIQRLKSIPRPRHHEAAAEVEDIARRLSEKQLTEGEAARQLLMCLGQQIELAVSAVAE